MSEHSASRRDQQIRSLREPKPTVDPWRPIGSLIERERRSDGSMDSVVVIFLAGRECPFTCVFCDLWSQTLDGATPLGSLPRQIDLALQGLGERAEAPTAVKLYNASNFFDPLAVPDADLGEVVRLVERFDRVTVESHPRYVGRRSLELAERLRGGLEVAMGLESIHPRVLPRLNKAMSLADFESATETLRGDGIAVRAFVLLGVPFLAAAEQVEWAVRSAEYAISVGAGNVSLIPTRGGNGEMERLESVGEWTPPSLGQLEAALEACVGHPGGVITADTWDLEALASCGECFERRRARLETMNLTGAVPARLPCGVCGWGTGCLG